MWEKILNGTHPGICLTFCRSKLVDLATTTLVFGEVRTPVLHVQAKRGISRYPSALSSATRTQAEVEWRLLRRSLQDRHQVRASVSKFKFRKSNIASSSFCHIGHDAIEQWIPSTGHTNNTFTLHLSVTSLHHTALCHATHAHSAHPSVQSTTHLFILLPICSFYYVY